VSSVLIGAGAAAAVGGVIVVLTAPKSSAQLTARPSAGGASLVLSGSF
jgi:gas vesicle protein